MKSSIAGWHHSSMSYKLTRSEKSERAFIASEKRINVIERLLLLALVAAAASVGSPAIGDTIFVSGSGKIEEFASDGVGSVFADTSSGCLAVDRAGNLYAGYGNDPNYSIVKFNPNGSSSVFANTGSYEPEGLAFDSAGNLYVSLYAFTTNIIEKFTPTGVGTVFAHVSPPGALAIDPAGNVYASIIGDNSIEKFTPAGVRSIFAAGSPSGLACDSVGNLYAGGSDGMGGNAIVRFTPTGVASVFAKLDNVQPIGLAFGSGGNLFMTNINYGLIEKFTPAGVSTVFANFGATNIAIQVVPEPPTTSLAGCGFATLALVALRRKGRRQNANTSNASPHISILSEEARSFWTNS